MSVKVFQQVEGFLAFVTLEIDHPALFRFYQIICIFLINFSFKVGKLFRNMRRLKWILLKQISHKTFSVHFDTIDYDDFQDEILQKFHPTVDQ